ncbi:hypothetical protein HSBAA_55380 [Vreelandella sulfidaeris]|uniref:Uncharacterized protein n=1 Tax=Vreelandella sulfidaeris TaxID=115553 RepID=A0A455UDB1_9GAMM|nr:hypothetical protein HSBAA_55380 [Halomonas sulfidaeris]
MPIETITISERLAAGAWAHSDSVHMSPPSEVPQQLPESVSYSADEPLQVQLKIVLPVGAQYAFL